jgi:hypothetical protein
VNTPEDPRFITHVPSDTPIADEGRRLESALRRAEPMAHVFDSTPFPVETVGKARSWWLEMMRTEYESASVFVDMCTQLQTIAAPLDVQTVVLRMAQDELRHAAICGRVVEAMGGEARIPATAPRRAPSHPDCGPDETALRTVIFGCCLGETVNAARLAKRIGEVRDPFVRDAFRLLLADERLHAQFGFYYLESRRAWLDAHPEVRRSLARYLRYAFATLERYMGAVPVDVRPLNDDERAIGLPDLTELSTTFQETILNASVPGLERFGVDAATAWRERTIVAPART